MNSKYLRIGNSIGHLPNSFQNNYRSVGNNIGTDCIRLNFELFWALVPRGSGTHVQTFLWALGTRREQMTPVASPEDTSQAYFAADNRHAAIMGLS